MAVKASPPPSSATKRSTFGSTPAVRITSAIFSQSWLPMVPETPISTFSGCFFSAATRSPSVL